MDSHPRPHSPGPAGQVSCIPTHSSSTPAVLRCCCGRNDCAFLQNNNLALEGLEKDLETAARLGQVRLVASLFSYCLFLRLPRKEAF